MDAESIAGHMRLRRGRVGGGRGEGRGKQKWEGKRKVGIKR